MRWKLSDAEMATQIRQAFAVVCMGLAGMLIFDYREKMEQDDKLAAQALRSTDYHQGLRRGQSITYGDGKSIEIEGLTRQLGPQQDVTCVLTRPPPSAPASGRQICFTTP